MNVLIVAPNITVGGVESYIANTLANIELRDCNIVVDIFIKGRNPDHHFSETWKKYANMVYEPAAQENRFQTVYRLFQTLKNQRYDIVHAHQALCAPAMLFSRFFGVPRRIVQSHLDIPPGISPRDQLPGLMLWIRRKIYLHNATDFLACSAAAAEYMFGKKTAEHAIIARNGIDTRKFRFRENERSARKKELGLENSFVIGHVGRFHEQKNHKFLIEIFREIAARDKGARLLLIGTGDLEDEVRSLVKKYCLEEKTIFVGPTDAVQDYMCGMDVFVLPSLYEGLGIVNVEAQASGLPCVVSDTVPQEAHLTDRIEFLPLEAGAGFWAEKILQYHPDIYQRDRKEAWREVYNAGYDISDTARTIQILYQNT